jgi:hypothetical protein
MRTRAWIAWSVFLAFTALGTYGFFAERLLDESIWTPVGIRRLMELIVVYGAITALIWFWRPPLFLHVLGAIAIAYTIATCGPLPVLAVGFVLLSSATLGSLIVGGTDRVLGTLVGLAVYVFTASLLAFLPVNTWILWTPILALPMAMRPRLAIDIVRPLLRPDPACAGGIEHAMRTLAVFPLVAHWLVALKPEASPDGLAMHLAIPAAVEFQRQWHFDVQQTAWAVMPMNGDWAYTIAYVLGGEMASKLLNLALLLLIAAMIFETVRRWLGGTAAWLSVALFASSPIVQILTGSMSVENFWAAMALGAFLYVLDFRQSGRPVALLAAGLLTGTAMASKFGAAMFVLPLAMIAIHRPRRRRSSLTAMAALLVMAVSAAPPYATAFAKTGNPVFPFFNHIFKSPQFSSSEPFVDVRFTAPLRARTPYDVTFRTSRHMEAHDGGFGFQYFVLVPVAVAMWRRKQPFAPRAALGAGLAFVVLILLGQSNARYLYPALPLLTIGTAWALCSLAPALAAQTAAVLLVGLNIAFLPASGWLHGDFFLKPFSAEETSQFREFFTPVHKLVEHLNRTAPGAPVVFLGTSHVAGLHGRAYLEAWHTPEFNARLNRIGSPLDALRLFNEIGVEWVIAPSPESGIAVRKTAVEEFLGEWTTREMASGMFYLARIREDVRGSSGLEMVRLLERGAIPSPPGSYDDMSGRISFTGGWIRDQQFSHAYRGSLVYTNVPGDTARFRFTGTGITYVHTKAGNRGIAEIYIDGRLAKTCDLYSPAIQWQAHERIVDLAEGDHTIEVRVLGTKSAAASDTFIDVDAFITK